jgi:hypothetical protein
MCFCCEIRLYVCIVLRKRKHHCQKIWDWHILLSIFESLKNPALFLPVFFIAVSNAFDALNNWVAR